MPEQLYLGGHSLAEYRNIFALTDEDLNKKIFDYGAGAASFNAEMYQLGKHVVSCDPMYALGEDQLRTHCLAQLQTGEQTIQTHPDSFAWEECTSLAEWVDTRKQHMQLFLDDFSTGKQQSRYCAHELHHLPFANGQFDLALSNYLFNASPQETEHALDQIKMLCAVANEIRIFPLLNETIELRVGPIMLALQQAGYGLEICDVNYHLYKQGNAMLRIWARTCDL